MKCNHCGAENEEGAVFCEECGQKITASAQPKNICPKCGIENKPGAKFCNGCGYKFAADSEITPDAMLQPETTTRPVQRQTNDAETSSPILYNIKIMGIISAAVILLGFFIRIFVYYQNAEAENAIMGDYLNEYGLLIHVDNDYQRSFLWDLKNYLEWQSSMDKPLWSYLSIVSVIVTVIFSLRKQPQIVFITGICVTVLVALLTILYLSGVLYFSQRESYLFSIIQIIGGILMIVSGNLAMKKKS